MNVAEPASESQQETHPDQVRMSLGEHLEELRRRIIVALVGVVIAAGIALLFGDWILWWLLQPLIHVQRAAGLSTTVFTHAVTTGFSVYMQVSLIAGAVVASPWVIYQLWLFIAAGLYPGERKAVRLLAPASGLLTLLGVGFMYYLLLPISLAFLIFFSTSFPAAGPGQGGLLDLMIDLTQSQQVEGDSASTQPPTSADPSPQSPDAATADRPVVVPYYEVDPANPVPGQVWIKVPENQLRVYVSSGVRSVPLATDTLISPLIEVGQYLSFVSMMAIGVVIAFQTPLVMLLASWAGILPTSTVRKYRRHCVFVCFVLGSVLTPADPLSMFILALPLWALFELGLLLMSYVERRRQGASAGLS